MYGCVDCCEVDEDVLLWENGVGEFSDTDSDFFDINVSDEAGTEKNNCTRS